MRRIGLMGGMLGLAAATGCSHRPTFDNPSKPIEVRTGSEFALALKSNQSTGYQWVLVDSAALGPLQLVGKDYSIPARNRNRNGAGGTERWTFRAPSPGHGVIALAYKRPWETRPPADSARFQVHVK